MMPVAKTLAIIYLGLSGRGAFSKFFEDIPQLLFYRCPGWSPMFSQAWSYVDEYRLRPAL